MIRNVLFDFDGTIVDSTKIIIPIYNYLADKYNYNRIDKDKFLELRKFTIRDRCKTMGVPMRKIPKLGVEAKGKFQDFIPTLKPIEGIDTLLHDLKSKGVNLGIVSSNSLANIKSFLEYNNLDFFDSIYSSSRLFGKHTTIRKYLKKHGISRKDVIYIGDEYRDIISCKKISIKIIGVAWGYDSVELLNQGKPDFMAYHPDDILKYIEGHS